MANPKPYRRNVTFTFDDGYGGEYEITAIVELRIESERRYAEVIEMDGLLDRDGGWIDRLQKEADEKAIDVAWDEHDEFRRADVALAFAELAEVELKYCRGDGVACGGGDHCDHDPTPPVGKEFW